MYIITKRHCTIMISGVCGIDSDSDSTGSGQRLRTNISIQQASILSQAYQQNNKPSRHALRQLGQETGLDARVVRVWFQNKRSKAKKTFPLNNYPLGQGHEAIENIDDDDSNGSFTGNESCRYNSKCGFTLIFFLKFVACF